MRCVIQGATDAASLLLFDPGALPPDFERRFQTDTGEILERLTGEGRACWVTTDSDGAFLLHAYVDEPVPELLRSYVVEPQVIEEFHVPSGQLVFAGSEYAFREDDNFLRKDPHIGASFLVRPGTYRLTVFRTEYPEDLVEDQFRAQASAWEFRIWTSMRGLIPLAIAAWIGLVVIFFTTVRVPMPRFLAPSLALVFALPFLVRRLETYRSARERFASLERQYPSVVAQLEYRDSIKRCQDR
jgi:hypothetical protein